MLRAVSAILLACAAAYAQARSTASAELHRSTAPYEPLIQPASEEGRQVLARFRLAPSFEAHLWAAEPMLANPVAFHAADSGCVYVCETFRMHQGVTDMREHMEWLDDDMRSKTVEDLVALFRKHLGEGFPEIERERERIRVLRDTDGDGTADRASVFADSFGDPADGIGAGVLERDGDVYFTCVPHLWLLRDEDGDDRADQRRSLSYGYGVHVQFVGHDLHGLTVGPDGYLYFSCGDRGFNVETPAGPIDHTHTGAVLRCELDGSDLEVYATGLRNPQELAFDDFGNLFTADNNSDGGDRARIVHVIDGSDSGWRNGWQWVESPEPRGMWNSERLWQTHFAGQAAYIVPPIANLASGPSGLAHDPGTSMPAPFAGRFFLCDFTGDPSSSSILAFAVERRASSFVVSAVDPIVQGSLVTDCDVGPDGALWFTDWVEGWTTTGKGRIYRAFDPTAVARPIVSETRALLTRGMRGRAPRELAELIGHRDQRVRLRAQLELGSRGAEGYALLSNAARSGKSLLERLHGVWGVGFAVRRDRARDSTVLLDLLTDVEPEIRAQAARMLGDLRAKNAAQALIARLGDVGAQVRLHAALALARIGDPAAVDGLIGLACEAGESDPALRHAAAQGLARCASHQQLTRLRENPWVDVRVAAVVALRRQRSAGAISFLGDREPRVVLEAARAIYDAPIPEGMRSLALMARSEDLVDPSFARRAVHAHWQIGDAKAADELRRYAMRKDQTDDARREALDLLARWAEPRRDPLMGDWRPMRPRDDAVVPDLVCALLDQGIASAPEKVAIGWVKLAGQHRVAKADGQLDAWALDTKSPPALRVESIRALEAIAPPALKETMKIALADPVDAVRAAALPVLERIAPEEALPFLKIAVRGAREERRSAYGSLARLPSPEAESILAEELDRLAIGLVPGELALDLVSACESRNSDSLMEKLGRVRGPRWADPALAPWLDCLLGGDPERGRDLFRAKTELACLRCHQIENPRAGGPEGGLVGPDLRGVGARLTRLELLESIVDPNRRYSAGYRATIVFRAGAGAVEGIIVDETPELLRLRDKDDQVIEIEKRAIETAKTGLSSMPENLKDFLSREEMRDLIEFLSRL